MNSKKVAETIQQTREWARAEYKEKTKALIFTKDFQTRQEALMHDPLATVGERVMAWILRRSWGEMVLYAIKNDGEPAHQRDCVKELGLSKRQVSAAVSYYQKRGYLEKKGKLLYPVISPALSIPQKVTDSSDFLQFMEEWKVTYSSDFEEEKVLRSRLKEKVKVRLSAYKKWRTPGQTAPVSLCIKTTESKGETASPVPSSLCVTTLPPAGRPLGWHPKLREILNALPIGTELDEPMFQRIAAHLSEELLPQFKAEAEKAKHEIRKWAGYEAKAKQVAARCLVKSAAAGVPAEESILDRMMRLRQQVSEKNG